VRILHSLFHRRRRQSVQVSNGQVRPPLHHRLRSLKFLRFASMMFFVATSVGIVGFLLTAAIVSATLPNPQQVVRHEGFSSKVMDRDGNLLYDVFDDERIIPIKEEDIPKYLRQATVATEDKDFYKHGGYDPMAPFRIFYNVVVNQRLIGSSSLTQQLVKNKLLNNERTLFRKFKELLLALQIEQAFSKEQILTMYMNEAPYGGNSRGVGAAAEQYFGKPVKDLTLVESAILAGLPQRPSVYSPLTGKKDSNGIGYWVGRTTGVLRRMREDGYITEDQEKFALDEMKIKTFQKPEIAIKAPHFVFFVKDLLEKEYGERVLETGGLKVTTSLDTRVQTDAQTIVKEEIDKVKNLKISNGSVMVMEPATGEILAMVGSKDYFSKEIDGQFNVAVDGLRQPGSSIKPITYLLALRRGFTPSSMIADTPTTFPGGTGQKDYEPKNYDGKFRGPVQLRFALGSSLNIPAVKLLAKVGVKDMLSLAYDMGFVTLEPTAHNQSRFGLSVTLGGGEIHLIDTITAYSSFANGGKKVDPVAILKIEDSSGKVLYEYKQNTGKQVVSAQEAFLMNHILSDNNARLLSFGANSQLNYGQRAVAVKTGTTNNQVDNWTIGWTRNAIIGVWVGNNDNSPMKSVASGLTGASPIWRRLMDSVIAKEYKDEAWEIPEGVEAKQVDVVSGYPEHEGFQSRAEYVINGTLPDLPDPIHTKLKLCRGQNKLASEADLARGEYDEKEFIRLREDDPLSKDGKNRWQEGIDSWINGQGDTRYRIPTENCDSTNEVFVSFDPSVDHQSISGNEVELKIRTATDGDIDRVEVFVNDALKTTLRDRPYQTKLVLDPGRYKIYARAYRKDGKTGTTTDQNIGMGGVAWDSSPSPSPSPSPTP
jgi:penicillin-binding protein 1C